MKPNSAEICRPCRNGTWVLLLCLFLFQSCDHAVIPDQLYGTWVTEDPGYQGCSLQISKNTLVFTNPETGSRLCFIDRVSYVTQGATMAVTIIYLDEDRVSFTAQLVYSTDNDGLLWFKNQPHVMWRCTH
jgi:hypothetical protein